MSVVSHANLSGSQWWHANEAKYPNSKKVADLAGDFRPQVEAFLKALADAGAKVSIQSTRRNETRAWLMYYSWQIAHGQILPKAVPKKTGLEIVWDHGDAARSRQAALQMVRLFGMAHQAALQSNHISGRAIDMDIA